MAKFAYSAPPAITPVIPDDLWELVDDWRFTYGEAEYCVPAGFLTDGASIPRILWRVCGHPMTAQRLPAALAHDWAYSGESAGVFTRADADMLYRDALIASGFPAWKASLEYYTLRLFGGSHYTKPAPQ